MTDGEHSAFPVVREGEIGGKLIQTVDGRELHRFLRVLGDYTSWAKNQTDRARLVENRDFVTFHESSGKGRPSREYHFALDAAKHIAMMAGTEEGFAIREYFLECERLAKDPVAALSNPETLRTLLLDNVNKVLALTARIEADKPKTNFYDAFASADGLFTLQNAGRAITGRPNKFIQELKRTFLFYQGGKLVPYVQYRQQGLFEVKVELVEDKAYPNTYITPKGLQYFAERFGREAA